MKNKIINIILCLVLLVSATAYAEETSGVNSQLVPEYSADSMFVHYLGLCDTLGIDTSYDGASSVTRGQFVKALCKLMNASEARFGTQSFADVSYDTPELLYAVEYAVAIGAVSDSDKFYPDDTVTYEQAYKMIVEAMGYGSEAKARGGYPYGYIYVANNYDLTDGLNLSGDFSFGDMCVLMGNAANAPVNMLNSVSPDGEGYVTEAYSRGETLLEYYHDIIRVEGIINASDGGYLYSGGESIDSVYVVIGEDKYFVSANVECPTGYYTEAYARRRAYGDYEIIYADLSQNDVTDIMADDITKVAEFYIEYDNGNNIKSKKLVSDYAVVYNGKAYGRYNWEEFSLDNGYVSLIDNNRDGSADVMAIWEPRHLEVRYADTHSDGYELILYDRYNTNHIYVSDDAVVNCKDGYGSFETGSIAEAYVSKDGQLIKLIKLSDIRSGKVTALGADGEIYIDDIKYGITSYFRDNYSSMVSLGAQISVALDSHQRIAAISAVPAGTMTVAYFDNIKRASDVSGTVTLKLFNSLGQVLALPLAEKISLDGASASAFDSYNKLLPYVGNMVLYSANANGEITKIKCEDAQRGIYDPSSDGTESVKRYDYPGYESESLIYYKSFGYFVPHFCISSSTKIFVVAEGESSDTKRFGLGNLSFLANDAKVVSSTIRPYNVSDTGHADILLYVTSNAKAPTLGKTSSSAVVSDVTMALDPDGEQVYKTVLYSSNKYTTYYISPDEDFIKSMNLKQDQMPYTVGDFIRYSTDESGKYIRNATVDFAVSSESLNAVYGDNTEMHYYYGKLYSVGDSSFGILLSNGDVVYLSSSAGDVGVVEDGEVDTYPIKRMPTYKQVGDECARILVRCRYSGVQTKVVYN